MDPEQTYFARGLSFPWAWLLLLRENPSLESLVSQARLTQRRLEVWLPWWHVHHWRARVLQTGTLMLVHTDHRTLDPSSYLQCAKEKEKCVLPPLMSNEALMGKLVGWTVRKGVSQLPYLSNLNITWIGQCWPLIFQHLVFFGWSFHFTESVSPSVRLG